MTIIFKKRQKYFIIQLLILSISMFSIHGYLNYHFFKKVILFFPLWHIYFFHIISITVIFSLINYKDSIGKTDIFNTFIFGMLIKMILTMIFLLPWILSQPEQKGVDLTNFFIPYFIYLTFEVYALTKFLQKKEPLTNI